MKINKLFDNEISKKVLCYWTEGHHSRHDFAEECNIRFKLDLTTEFSVQPEEVVKGWLKKQEHPDYDCWVEPCSEDDEDAIAATYFFYDYD